MGSFPSGSAQLDEWFREEHACATGHEILIVERDASRLEVTATILEQHGYGVHRARDGRSALKLADTLRTVRLALVDLDLRDMTVRALIEGLQERVPAGLSVVYTAESEPADSSLRPVLTRPISADLLLATVECVFDFG